MKITIVGDEGLPVQVDGEAWVQRPGIIRIHHKNRAQMLTRDKVWSHSPCLCLSLSLSLSLTLSFSLSLSGLVCVRVWVSSCRKILVSREKWPVFSVLFETGLLNPFTTEKDLAKKGTCCCPQSVDRAPGKHKRIFLLIMFLAFCRSLALAIATKIQLLLAEIKVFIQVLGSLLLLIQNVALCAVGV